MMMMEMIEIRRTKATTATKLINNAAIENCCDEIKMIKLKRHRKRRRISPLRPHTSYYSLAVLFLFVISSLRLSSWDNMILLDDNGSSSEITFFCQAEEQHGPSMMYQQLSLSSSSSLFSSLDDDSSSYSPTSKARIVIPSSTIASSSIHNGFDVDVNFDDKDYFEFESETETEKLLWNSMRNNPSIISHQRGQRRRIAPTMIEPISIHRSNSCTVGSDTTNNNNDSFGSSSSSSSSYKKTGTTIAGCVVVDKHTNQQYVILGADTRATEGTIVADKRCDKIHKLAANCRCCGAGTSADLDKVTRQVLFSIALKLNNNESSSNNGPIITNNESTSTTTSTFDTKGTSTSNLEPLYQDYGDDDADVSEDNNNELLWMKSVSIDVLCNIFQDTLFNSKGQLGANLILGGVWNGKASLRAIHPHGSADIDLPFTALGSGGLAAISVLEDSYNSCHSSVEEGIKLVQRAILAGIQNDLGSGSQVDICIIGPTDGQTKQIRGIIQEEELLPDNNNNNNNSATVTSKTTTTTTTTNRLSEILNRKDNTIIENNDNEEDNNIVVGVNGFGNQPFAIEGIKQRVVSTEIDEATQKKIWDRVLGL
jgi:20S proteasome subunit beta 2